MSDYELRKGKLKEIEVLDIESFAKAVFHVNYTALEQYWENYTEWFREDCDTHVIVNSKVYEIIEDNRFDDVDIFDATKNTDGTIDYTLRYYNGGCGYNEAIETALKRMSKSDE